MPYSFIFKAGGRELTLPVTPESFALDYGVSIETISIHDVGEADIFGKTKLSSFQIKCLLPARNYTFANTEMEPYDYIRQFQKWARTGKVLRFIIPDTIVNLPVRIENVQFGENDGSGDVLAMLTLKQHRALEALRTEAAPDQNAPREDSSGDSGAETSYTAVYGDTLCSICRKFYGDGSAKFYNALAKYNGKPNPNLLMTGEVLQIPSKSALGV